MHMRVVSSVRLSGVVRDPRGVPLTVDSPDALAAIEAAVVGLVSHRASTLSNVERTIALDSDLVLAHVMKGFGAKLLVRRDRADAATLSLAAAQASLERRGGTEREHGLVAALAHWCAGEPWRAADALDEVLAHEPHDLLAMKLGHALRFMFGDIPGMRRALERALPKWDPALTERAWVEGCWAFTLEEMGELDRAERLGRAALERNPIDPWGAHAVAHVWHTRGEPRRGLAWLDQTDACLADANNFAAHVSWHRAVLLIAVGELERALDLYDRRVALPASVDYRDFVNAATLLYRLERRGLSVGARWDVLADVAIGRAGDHTHVFADLHYLLALARAGRSVETRSFVRSMSASCGQTHDALMREVGLPVARAIAEADTAPRSASETIGALGAQLTRLGGSAAQREIFSLVAADSRARAIAAEAHSPSANSSVR